VPTRTRASHRRAGSPRGASLLVTLYEKPTPAVLSRSRSRSRPTAHGPRPTKGTDKKQPHGQTTSKRASPTRYVPIEDIVAAQGWSTGSVPWSASSFAVLRSGRVGRSLGSGVLRNSVGRWSWTVDREHRRDRDRDRDSGGRVEGDCVSPYSQWVLLLPRPCYDAGPTDRSGTPIA